MVRLVAQLAAVREPRMRRVLVGEALAASPPDAVVAALHVLIGDARGTPRPELTAALDALAGTLADETLVPYQLRADLYAAACTAGHDEVASMLFEGFAAEAAAAAKARPLTPRGRPLTLGERKSMARGGRRDLLAHLLRDPHPDVIAILLDNPHLVERDVLALASRRTAPGATLAILFGCDRWICRYAVKRALVLNPASPPHLALRLLPTFATADLRAVATDNHLATPVRTQAGRLLAGAER